MVMKSGKCPYITIMSDPKRTEYVYVDAATGKSKNELYSDVFNEISGTNGWLTLKEVDDIANK